MLPILFYIYNTLLRHTRGAPHKIFRRRPLCLCSHVQSHSEVVTEMQKTSSELAKIDHVLVGSDRSSSSIIYFIDLQKHNDCECSRNWKRYSLIAPMIAILIALLLTVIAVIYLRTFLKLNKKNSKKMLNKLFKNKK